MVEIGRVIGTERRPNTAYTFFFWADPAAPIGIGTLVRSVSESGEVTVYGVVVEAHGFNDLESPLHEFLSVGGDPSLETPTRRPEMRVYEVAVLRRVPEEPIGAVPIGRVFAADEADVREALNTAQFADEFGIPCGCYGSTGDLHPVHLHAHFLLGPESGHLNMTGTSGLAAKTSFIQFLLASIFSRPEVFEGGMREGVAALLFNTKGGDLLYLDVPADGEPGDVDAALYRACGIEPRAFTSVRYYAPPISEGGLELNTLRRHPTLEVLNPTRRIVFGLEDMMDHIAILMDRDDLDSKADSYLKYLRRFTQKGGDLIREKRLECTETVEKVSTLSQLLEVIERQLEFAREKGVERVDTHHTLTMQKVLSRLSGLGHRFSGLISRDGRSEGPLEGRFEPGSVTVIDIAGLGSIEQDLVFAASIRQLRKRMEENKLGIKHLVVMVDELNKYAPSGGRDSTILRELQDIAARGRYLGLTLFGAQQFRSRVDKEVVGNAATHVFGHVEAEELAQPGYSYFSTAVREKLGSLNPGEVLIKHPHFKQPIFIRFPRPWCLSGSQGMLRFPVSVANVREQILKEASKRGLDAKASEILDSTYPDEAAEDQLLRRIAALPDSRDQKSAVERLMEQHRSRVGGPEKPRERPGGGVEPFDL
ncbi:MAG TPA: ATP-binding protein [Fimbriimonadaceae bacterium]|nr:ATP-binding protein [Fimbriimonadaceae bacterium]